MTLTIVTDKGKFLAGRLSGLEKKQQDEHRQQSEERENFEAIAKKLNKKLAENKGMSSEDRDRLIYTMLARSMTRMEGDTLGTLYQKERGPVIQFVNIEERRPFTLVYDMESQKFLVANPYELLEKKNVEKEKEQENGEQRLEQSEHEARTSDMQVSPTQGNTRLQDISLPELERSNQGESTPVKSTLDDLDWPKPRSKSEELRQDFTKKIIALMEQGEAPWQRPWKLPTSCMPANAVSDKPYHGNNIMYLMIAGMNAGYSDPRWVTYKQAQEKGWQVKKGERGTKIEYYSKYDPTKTKKGEEQLDERVRDLEASGVPPEEIQEALENYDGYKKGFIKHYVVFNAEQIEGIPPREIEPVIKDFKPHERAENIMGNCGVPILYGGIGAAYSPGKDHIRMPNREWFSDESTFYSTVLHEIAHSTGHSSRLNREEGMKSAFGTREYAKEELRAEMAGLFINAGIGLTVTEEGLQEHTKQHAAYVQHWLKNLKDDYKEFFRATHDASKIADYVLAYEKELTLTHEHQEIHNPGDAEIPEPSAFTSAPAVESKEPSEAAMAIPEVERPPDNLPFEPEAGQRVTFQPHEGKTKLTGTVKEVSEHEVVLQCGRLTIPTLREKGAFAEAPEPDRTFSKEFAKEQAQQHVRELGNVFTAKGEGAVYKGAIVELTLAYAIQKVGEDAILHRLKDLEKADSLLIQAGQDVSITKGGKGEILVEPWNREQEEHSHAQNQEHEGVAR
jgi:antirestriction protein ArdC